MIKIFSYIGSNNGNSSVTRWIAQNLADSISEAANEEVVSNIYSGKDTNISECAGCIGCFTKGKCGFDEIDDMKKLKKEMMEADIIVLGSPVFFHSVSGNMKKFIDRTAYWTHLMKLTGKLGVVVATSGGNGLEFVTSYLKKFYDFLGIHNVGEISVASYTYEIAESNGVLANLKEQIDKVAKELLNVYYNIEESNRTFSEFQEKIFQYNNKKYGDLEEYKDVAIEVNEWYKSGYLEYTSFKDLFIEKFKEKSYSRSDS